MQEKSAICTVKEPIRVRFSSTLYGVLVEGVSVRFVLVECHKDGLIAGRVFPEYTGYGGAEVGDFEQRAVHLQVTSGSQKYNTSVLKYLQPKVFA